MGGKGNLTAISHTCEGLIEGNSMISRNEVKASKRGPTKKTNRFCSISENIDIEEVNKGLANMHATDKSEKSGRHSRARAQRPQDLRTPPIQKAPQKK